MTTTMERLEVDEDRILDSWGHRVATVAAPPGVAYHYTTREGYRGILQIGSILPASIGIPDGQKPVAWFSTHPSFEPTAAKVSGTASGIRRLTPQEQREIGGAYRFVVPRSLLLPWSALRRAAHLSPRTQRMLVAAGEKQGADPAQWFGSTEPVSVFDVRAIAEKLLPDGTWRPVFRCVTA